MFCVIQEIEQKKYNPYGECKEIELYTSETYDGRPPLQGIRFVGEKCFRPVRTAYKVSIHHSFREQGRVKKQQFAIATIDYYDFVEYWYGECIISRKVDEVAEALQATSEAIWKLLEDKLEPLRKKINDEFRQTEEYALREAHRKIERDRTTSRDAFMEKYGIQDTTEYYRCYDALGKLVNKAYRDKVIREAKERRDYEKRSKKYKQKFYEEYFNNSRREEQTFGSGSNITKDRDLLKQFYRVLSKQFHPDANPTKDTSKEMQLLNQLKEDWGV